MSKTSRYEFRPRTGKGRTEMNKTTKTALHAKSKSELVDFAWIMVKMYNKSQQERAYLESIIIKQGEQK